MRRHIETADHLLWTVIFSTMKITLVMAQQQSEMNVYSFSVCMKEFHISTKHGICYQLSHKLYPQYNTTIYDISLTNTFPNFQMSELTDCWVVPVDMYYAILTLLKMRGHTSCLYFQKDDTSADAYEDAQDCGEIEVMWNWLFGEVH